MRWIVYSGLSLVSGAAGLLGGGLVAAACVDWYRVSSFEGKSGFFIVGLALVGGIAGLVVGLVACGAIGPRSGGEYLRAVAVSTGLVVALAAAIAGVCRALADVPPELDGRPLVLEIELRLPAGARKPGGGPGESYVELHSVVSGTSRRSERGRFDAGAAREEEGRWIVPASVRLFTRRGSRSVDFVLDGERLQGFVLPVPARPGRGLLEWSEWGPRPPAPAPPWPDSKPSFRFRVRKVEAPRPPTEAQIEAERDRQEQAAFDGLSPDAPLYAWFPYTSVGVPAARREAAVARITARGGYAAELGALMKDADGRRAAEALRLVELLPAPSPELAEYVREAGGDIARRMREANAATVEQDPGYVGAADALTRFTGWMVAVRALRARAGGDFTPELKTILELSRVRTDSITMNDIRRIAAHHLKEWTGIEPLPTDPKPR